MYEDEPSDKVHDVLAERRLRRPPAGAAGHRHAPRWSASVPVPDIAAYHDAPLRRRRTWWSPRPATSSTSGSSSWSSGRSTAHAPATARRTARAGARRGAPRASASTRRRPSSTTSASARPGIPRGDDRRFALRVLDTILGGSTSSRLFQEVREKRGLAYAVYSYASQYVDSGQVGIYVGTRPDNVRRGAGGDRRRAAPAASTSRVADDELERAQGEREGPHGAVDGVDARRG